MSLENILTVQNPLGPADQMWIRDPDDRTDILFRVRPFLRAFALGASVIIGRKGSGKTSLICEYQAAAANRRSSHLFEESELTKKTFVVDGWDQFHSMVRTVWIIVCKGLPSHNGLPSHDFLFPEHVSEVWHKVIWHHLLQCFYSFGAEQDSFPTILDPVREWATLESVDTDSLDPSWSSVSEAAEQLINNARDAILRFLRGRKQKCYLLFDNMDKYPIRNPMFANVISGFLRCINIFNAECEEIYIVFCMPEEIERFLQSDNLEKDYSRLYRLRWRPADLLQIVAHRYRLFIKIHQPDFYQRHIKDMDFTKREHLQELFRIMFPNDVINQLGHHEHPIAYIVRHTQLLPRHFILVFNRILSLSQERFGSFSQIGPGDIRDGVEAIEPTIANHILAPYNLVYPQLLSACRDVLPQLPPICDLSHLDQVGRQFKGRIENEICGNPWRVLVDMGILGEVIADDERQELAGEPRGGEASAYQSRSRARRRRARSPQSQTYPPDSAQSRYVYGAFHYNSTEVVGFEDGREYCFHPIFSRAFGMKRAPEDRQQAVYPANVGLFEKNESSFWGGQLND